MTKNAHWTERSIEDFVHKISTDFILQIEKKMSKEKMSQKELANALKVSFGRVSQFLNNPGNLTLKKVVEYSRTLGIKVAIVAYEDGDSENRNGPINSEIFYKCWQRQGSPQDFISLETAPQTFMSTRRIGLLDSFGFINFVSTSDAAPRINGTAQQVTTMAFDPDAVSMTSSTPGSFESANMETAHA